MAVRGLTANESARAHLEHDARKFLRPDDNQRHDPDYDKLAGVKIEHQKTSLKTYRRFCEQVFGLTGICGPRPPPRLVPGSPTLQLQN
jgi:hypothetical protein